MAGVPSSALPCLKACKAVHSIDWRGRAAHQLGRAVLFANSLPCIPPVCPVVGEGSLRKRAEANESQGGA